MSINVHAQDAKQNNNKPLRPKRDRNITFVSAFRWDSRQYSNLKFN